jgi:hypothetical protein
MPDWMLCLCLWRASDNPRPVLHGNQYGIIVTHIQERDETCEGVCLCSGAIERGPRRSMCSVVFPFFDGDVRLPSLLAPCLGGSERERVD